MLISALQHKSNSISNFFEEKKNWFPWCSTREDLSVDVSITNVGLILTKPGRFFFSTYGNSEYGQNSIWSISNILKKFHISGFLWCSTREDHSIDASITNVGLILTKPGRFLFSAYGNSGYGQNSISLISNFLKKITFLGFYGIVLEKTIPLMHQLIM